MCYTICIDKLRLHIRQGAKIQNAIHIEGVNMAELRSVLNLRLFGRGIACNAEADPATGAVTAVSFDEIMAALTMLSEEEKQQLIQALTVNLGQQDMLASSRQSQDHQFTSQLAKTLGVPATTPRNRMLAQVNSLLRAGTSAQLVLIEQECEKVAGARELRTFDGSIRKENTAYRYLMNHIDHEDLSEAKKQIDAIAKGDKIFKQLLGDLASTSPASTIITQRNSVNSGSSDGVMVL